MKTTMKMDVKCLYSLNSIVIYYKFLLKNRLDRIGISPFKLTFPLTKLNIFSLHVCVVLTVDPHSDENDDLRNVIR